MANFVITGFKTSYNGQKAVDMVEIAPSGEAFDRTKTWHRIPSLKPPENPNLDSMSHLAMIERWKVIGPAYEAWRSGNAIPEDGTPLAAWSAVTPEQADVFKRMGIRTIEDVADMGEGATAKLPFPNARKFPQLAKDFLSGKSKADAAIEMDAMREKMAAMEEMLAGYMNTEEKRGPGRPRKEAAA